MYLIPMPKYLKINDKEKFIFNYQTKIYLVNKGIQINFSTAKHLTQNISILLGFNTPINVSPSISGIASSLIIPSYVGK